jgi:hypothetical protein
MQQHLPRGFQVVAAAVHDGAHRQDGKANGLPITRTYYETSCVT